jgi:MoCo/4Fe-4S cofactor protein with predicted Tat translocation signal
MREDDDRSSAVRSEQTRPEDGQDRARAGRAYWRSLDELADTPEFQALVEKEFPGLAEELLSPQTRRSFLKIMGASLGVAGLAACRWPKEAILPFAHRPEDRTPGVPQQYATAFEVGGAAVGLLVTSFDGRPVKIEGNPLHPINRGTADVLAQASVLELYDPDRSRQVVRREAGQSFASSWDGFAAFAGPHFAGLKSKRGAGLAVLTESSSSPSFARLRRRLGEVLPKAEWVEYEPLSRDNEREGTRLLFGAPHRPQLRLDRAQIIVSLDADPLLDHPAALKHAREFAAGRRADDGTMNRLYAAESALSITGAMADERIALPSGEVEGLAWRLAARLADLGIVLPPQARTGGPGLQTPGEAAFFEAAARDLAAHRGRGVVIAGARQRSEVHRLVHLLNAALGNTGATVTYTADPDPSRPPHMTAIRDLAAAMRAGRVGTLLILGGNPAFDAPADLGFGEAAAKVPVTVRLGLFDDETSRLARWQLPCAHFLEAWGDVRGWDGTVSVVQPLIDPLYGGRSPIEVVAAVLGEQVATGHEIVRATVLELTGATDFEARWRRTLHDGVLAGSEFAIANPQVRPLEAGVTPPAAVEAPGPQRLEAVFCADRKVYDGRFANNAWLQELPDQLTKITWDNAATLSPATAGALGVKHGDVVRIANAGRSAEIVVYVLPGQADNTVVLPLGYGRTAAGRVGNGVGFDTYAIRTSRAPFIATGVTVERTGRTYSLACTQDHQAIDRVGYEARGTRIAEFVREGTLAEYRKEPEFARKRFEEPAVLPLWQAPKFTGEHQWAMSIDLSACIGCNACTMACQAENNILVVGKEQVIRGREMHWIRVDRYFSGPPESPSLAFQPVACQHCENAPCEEVCPVAATVHSDEGLNEQVYNRCVGTRYCSNNCPYKVRRFNFFNYFKDVPEVERMVFNPEVTVRGRGVMEKCSFCIQRIEAVKIAAKNDNRPIRDGEIVPACAQTCPTQAIVFGDLKDPQSRVSKLHAHNRAYSMLDELFTKPRTRYLAKLRNPSAADGEA